MRFFEDITNTQPELSPFESIVQPLRVNAQERQQDEFFPFPLAAYSSNTAEPYMPTLTIVGSVTTTQSDEAQFRPQTTAQATLDASDTGATAQANHNTDARLEMPEVKHGNKSDGADDEKQGGEKESKRPSTAPSQQKSAVDDLIQSNRTNMEAPPGGPTRDFLDSLPENVREALRSQFAELQHYHPPTAAHSRRVTEIALLIGRQMGLSTQQMDLIRAAGIMHDIGKLDISLDLLNRSDGISPMEYSVLQQHARRSFFRIENTLTGGSPLAWVAAMHHEDFGGGGFGGGYPLGLKARDVDLVAHILKVADVFDATSSERAHHREYSGSSRLPITYSHEVVNQTRPPRPEAQPVVFREGKFYDSSGRSLEPGQVMMRTASGTTLVFREGRFYSFSVDGAPREVSPDAVLLATPTFNRERLRLENGVLRNAQGDAVSPELVIARTANGEKLAFVDGELTWQDGVVRHSQDKTASSEQAPDSGEFKFGERGRFITAEGKVVPIEQVILTPSQFHPLVVQALNELPAARVLRIVASDSGHVSPTGFEQLGDVSWSQLMAETQSESSPQEQRPEVASAEKPPGSRDKDKPVQEPDAREGTESRQKDLDVPKERRARTGRDLTDTSATTQIDVKGLRTTIDTLRRFAARNVSDADIEEFRAQVDELKERKRLAETQGGEADPQLNDQIAKLEKFHADLSGTNGPQARDAAMATLSARAAELAAKPAVVQALLERSKGSSGVREGARPESSTRAGLTGRLAGALILTSLVLGMVASTETVAWTPPALPTPRP